MDSQSRHRNKGGFQASRGVALAGIVVLHVAAIALALSMKGPQADATVDAEPILVTLTAESRPVAAPDVKVKLQEVPLPMAVTPDVQISVPVEAPRAISVAVVSPAPPAPPAPSADAAEGDGPVTVTRPDYLRPPTPVYPAAAKRARAQGVVHVRAMVDVEGLPRDVRVERSSGFPALDKAACEAVLGAQFKPYRRNNIARAMLVIVPVEFSLKVRTASSRGRAEERESELDVRGEYHHAMGRHAEELGSLSAASLHPGE